MVLAKSSVSGYGEQAPSFRLLEPCTGKMRSLAEFDSFPIILICFICNHCPYVHHIQRGLVQLANDYKDKGVATIAINSNDAKSYPEDSPDKMKEVAEKHQYPFVYLYDESQEVARAYGAQCTPECIVLDADRKNVYRGQMDDSRLGKNIPVTGSDLRLVFDALLAGKKVQDILPDPKASVGCSIKWLSYD